MQSVAFITCVDNELLYRRCLNHINALDKESFQVEVVKVVNNRSLAAAYNEGMRRSKAKYKVYLHQDTFILEGNFLHYIHHFFKTDPLIGMIGMLGGRWLPADSPRMLVENCLQTYGCVYKVDGFAYIPQFAVSLWGGVEQRPYEWVTVIDGMIMITQYDFPWREDIIDGFHFYDLSQSLEFWKRNYKVIVLRQVTPWCAHICSRGYNNPEFLRLQEVFRREYRRYLSTSSRPVVNAAMRYKGKRFQFKVRMGG